MKATLLKPTQANIRRAKKAGYILTKDEIAKLKLPDKHKFALRIMEIRESVEHTFTKGDILVTSPWMEEGKWNKKITNRKS